MENSYCITVKSEKKDLFNGLDTGNVKIIDTAMVENDDSMFGTVSVSIPKCKENIFGLSSTMEEIKEWLEEQFDKGNLFPRSNYNQYELKTLFSNHKVSYTLLKKLVVKGDSVSNEIYDMVSELIDNGRLYDNLSIFVRKNYRSEYMLSKSVDAGEILRFKYGDVVLYID